MKIFNQIPQNGVFVSSVYFIYISYFSRTDKQCLPTLTVMVLYQYVHYLVCKEMSQKISVPSSPVFVFAN